MKEKRMKLNDRVRKMAAEGMTADEIADQLLKEKNEEVERRKKK